jgi:hypothetical protein
LASFGGSPHRHGYQPNAYRPLPTAYCLLATAESIAHPNRRQNDGVSFTEILDSSRLRKEQLNPRVRER